MKAYESGLAARLDPPAAGLHLIFERLHASPRRVVFAEGEEERVIRSALAFRNAGYGTPVLIGREERVRATMAGLGLGIVEGLEIHNARLSGANPKYVEFLYARLQRRGFLQRDCQRMVNQDRNVFAACMVALGDADALVTGVTRNFSVAYEDVRRAIDPAPGQQVFGLVILVSHARTVFIADTTVHDEPGAEELADIAAQSAEVALQMGHKPRVAFLSFSNFGNPPNVKAERIQRAVTLLDRRKVAFEYDGEMAADVALDSELLKIYPFCRLSGPANVLVMPGLYSASIASKILQKLGGGTIIGPLLIGLSQPAQIAGMDSTVSDIVNHAALAAHDAID